MPSMHVSIAVLIALSLDHLNRFMGLPGWFYVFVMQLGSVHLAWHSAIDGCVSILSTALIGGAVGCWQSTGYKREGGKGDNPWQM